MCTYEHLVDVTLAHGRIPLVVPQLRTITLGGAVTGLGIESTSFRNGLPHESVLEMDVLTGAGEVVTSKPGDALFDAFPNSYGSLGYATRLRIELEPCRPSSPCATSASTTPPRSPQAVARIVEDRACDGERVDGLDGVAFSPTELYLTLARWTDEPGDDLRLHRPAGVLPLDPAAHHRPAHGARLPVALGHRLVLVLAGLRRPAPGRTPRVAAPAAPLRRLLEARRPRPPLRHRRPPRPPGRPPAEASGSCRTSRCRSSGSRSSSTGSTARSACARSGCARCGCGATTPASGRGPATRSARARPTSTSGSGAWSTSAPTRPGRPRNRAIEAKVSELGGHKSLYSEAFYDREDVRPPLRRRPPRAGEGLPRSRRPADRPSTTRWCTDDELALPHRQPSRCRASRLHQRRDGPARAGRAAPALHGVRRQQRRTRATPSSGCTCAPSADCPT